MKYSKIILYTVFVVTLASLCSFLGILEKFVKIEIGSGISLKLPESFQPMPEEEIARKYVSTRKPVAVFMSADRQADFGINISITQWSPSDLPIMKDFYKATIMELHSDVKFIREEIVNVNGKDYAVLEFTSLVKDEDNTLGTTKPPVQKYNYIQYTIFDQKTFVYNFNCPANQKDRFQDLAQQIMSSIEMKKAKG